MAENRTFDQFLSDLRSHKGGSTVGSWEGFQEFLQEAVEKIENSDEVTVGSNTYEPETFLSFFAGIIQPGSFFSGQLFLFKPTSSEAFQKLRGQLTELHTRFTNALRESRESGDTSYHKTLPILKDLLKLEGFESKDHESKEENPAEAGAREAIERLSSGIANARRETEETLKPYIEKKIEGEEIPDAEKPEQLNILELRTSVSSADELAKIQKAHELREKAKEGLRKKRAETVSKYKEELTKKQKELFEALAQSNNVAYQFLKHSNKESAEFLKELADSLARALSQNRDGSLRTVTSVSARVDAPAVLSEAFSDLSRALDELKKEHEKLETKYKQELGTLVVPDTTSRQDNDSGGAEQKDEEEETRTATLSYDSLIRDRLRMVREIETFAYALSETSAKEFSRALGNKGGSDPKAEIRTYIAARTAAIQQLLKTSEADKPDFDIVEAALDAELATLIAVWRAFSEKPEEKEPANVPQVDTTSQPQVGTPAAGLADDSDDLSARVRKISRAQHDVLAVAENELAYKMKQAGLNDQQIQELLDKNRPLLLDSIRYKSFEAANRLKPGETLSSAVILGMIAEEVDVFYLKLANTNAQLNASLGGITSTTVDELRRQLQELSQKGVVSLNEGEIAQIVSGFEQGRFQPLVEYFKNTQGHFDGGAQLAQILTQDNGIVDRRQVNILIQRLTGGDFAAVFEPGLTSLDPNSRAVVSKRLEQIFSKFASSGVISAEDERYVLSQLSRNPQAHQALLQYFAQFTFNDTYNRMHQMHGLLSKVDKGLAGSHTFRPMAPALGSFAGPSTSATPVQANTYEQLSDEDKFMLQVALSTAYERMRDADPSQRAVLQGEIAVLVHEMYSGGGTSPVLMLEQSNADAIDAGFADVNPRSPGQAMQRRAGSRERFANFTQNVMNGAGQSYAQAQRAQQLQTALKLLKTGGNPAQIALLLLTDKKAREMVLKAVGYTIVIGGTGSVVAAGAFLNALTSIPIIGPIIGSIFGLGGGGGSSVGAFASTSSQVGGELSKGALSALRDGNTQLAKSIAANRPALEAGARSALDSALNTSTNFVYNTSNATMAGGFTAATILGPLSMISFFTIIVITVIGTSMNGYPGRVGMLANYNPLINIGGVARCWPVEGNISLVYHPQGNRVTAGGTAIDISATIGKPVFTPFNGTARWKVQRPCDPVTKKCSATGYAGYGNHVRITTDQGFDIILAHFSAFPDGIANGDVKSVVAGQLVGLNGSTGNSTGPHVHYEVLPTVSSRPAPNIFQILPKPVSELYIGYPTSPTACAAEQSSPSETVTTPNTSGSTL